MYPSTKPTTPTELVVLVWFVAGVFTTLGGIALWKASQLPPEKAEIIAGLNHYGGWSLGIGLAIAVIFWLIRRYLP
jgi:predicted small integral membrane protein